MSNFSNNVINQIEEVIKDIPGWTPLDQLYTLFNLVYLTSDLKGDIVEIGSWCGRSAVVLGTAAQLIGNTNICCIDFFPEKNDWNQNIDGSYSLTTRIGNQVYDAYQIQTVWEEPFVRDIAPIYHKYNSVFDIFIEKIAKNNLQDLVKAFKGNSDMFVDFVSKDFQCKLVFIDGDHSYEAVSQDIKNLEPYLIEGGWICFDDAFSYYEGVNRAIEEFIVKNPSYELCQQMTRKLFIARKKYSNSKPI